MDVELDDAVVPGIERVEQVVRNLPRLDSLRVTVTLPPVAQAIVSHLLLLQGPTLTSLTRLAIVGGLDLDNDPGGQTSRSLAALLNALPYLHSLSLVEVGLGRKHLVGTNGGALPMALALGCRHATGLTSLELRGNPGLQGAERGWDVLAVRRHQLLSLDVSDCALEDNDASWLVDALQGGRLRNLRALGAQITNGYLWDLACEKLLWLGREDLVIDEDAP